MLTDFLAWLSHRLYMSTAVHGNSLRKGRVSIPGQIYILTAVTHGRTRWFANFEIGCLAARTLTRPMLWPDARLVAWVLMPDHLHLMVELGEKDSLSLVVQRLKSVISTAIRRELGNVNVWQAGFHDHAIRRNESVRDVGRYLIANPLRAGIVACVGDYPFWDAEWLEPDCDPLDI